jgi:hypothetical protein
VSRCWGGIVVALGEFSRALALLGLMDRKGAAPRPQQRQKSSVAAEAEHERVLR